MLVVGAGWAGADCFAALVVDVRMPVMDGLQAARQILTATVGSHTPRVLI